MIKKLYLKWIIAVHCDMLILIIKYKHRQFTALLEPHTQKNKERAGKNEPDI